MPLTMPSTAWSRGASSKMMFAALPPSSSVSRLPVPAIWRWIALPTSVEPVNAIFSTSACDDVRARPAVARDDVDDAWRQLGLAEDVAEEQRGQRRRLGRLEHDRVPGRERRRDLPREHQQREVPGDDLARDAERPRRTVRERVLELVRPARVVEEVRRSERQVDVARLADRLAAVQRLEHGELARTLLEQARDPEQVLRALGARECRPAVLVRRARSIDCEPHVVGARLRDLRERLLRRGADRRVPLAGARLDPLATDEQAVALVDGDDVTRLRGVGVVPARLDGQSAALLLELRHQSIVK